MTKNRNFMRRFLFSAALLSLALPACTSGGAPATGGAVATMSTLASLTSAVVSPHLAVTSLVPVGASVEEFQPRPRDVATLHGARLLVENGAGLETWLRDTIDGAKNPELRVIVCTAGLPVEQQNPHLWMDPAYAKIYVEKIAAAAALADPADARDYAEASQRYGRRLDQLDRWIRMQIATIPPDRRTMIVFHNAWYYYAKRYGIQLVGVVERNPGQEPSAYELANLVDLAKRHHVRAVFAEPQFSPKLVQQLARSAGIRTVENLYDDSVGERPEVADYVSMMRYDTVTIVKALGGGDGSHA
ncbi:zinc ABC transporter substrate-binding protein [bacterium]|nr:MAG: zinc ABC transporter substrate-binding protein [bacterium]